MKKNVYEDNLLGHVPVEVSFDLKLLSFEEKMDLFIGRSYLEHILLDRVKSRYPAYVPTKAEVSFAKMVCTERKNAATIAGGVGIVLTAAVHASILRGRKGFWGTAMKAVHWLTLPPVICVAGNTLACSNTMVRWMNMDASTGSTSGIDPTSRPHFSFMAEMVRRDQRDPLVQKYVGLRTKPVSDAELDAEYKRYQDRRLMEGLD